MAGLIDQGGNTGLAYTNDAGLQWESRIGTGGLILNPGESAQGYALMENAGYILLENDVPSYIQLES